MLPTGSTGKSRWHYSLSLPVPPRCRIRQGVWQRLSAGGLGLVGHQVTRPLGLLLPLPLPFSEGRQVLGKSDCPRDLASKHS